ncbi:SdpI family protein [bacterium]|nr:SdpI family protein [bacterium]
MRIINPISETLYFVGASLLFILLALPLLMNRIKPNAFYGLKLAKVQSDERIWYLANSFAAKGIILTGIVTIVLAVALRLMNVAPEMYKLICTVALLGGLMLTVIVSLVYVDRIS